MAVSLTLGSGLSGSRPMRTCHIVQATSSQGTAKRTPAPIRTPSKSYTLTEVTGSVEHNLLSARPPVSTSPHSAGPPRQPSSPLPALPTNVRDLFLPPGYPTTVTPDYLPYQLWSFPTHITGHLSHALVTSSLLAAVGITASPAATVTLSASIKWIVKDGIGALGRLIVGSRFSAEFDEDPRRWRLVAELLSTVGLGLEVATSLHPQYFLMLASAGKFCQALGKGMGKPVFRVIQTHFARAQNVGAVAAKEEVWEVVAQMGGLAASVALLRALEATGSADGVVGSWAAIQAVHVALRYQALRSLLFDSISLKRAALLARASVSGKALPGIVEANAQEPLMADPWDVRPHVRLGCTAAEAFGGGGLPPPSVLQSYAEMYDGEGYVLVWRDGGAYVMLKEGHSTKDMLRAVWQAAWLDYHHHGHGDDHSGGRMGEDAGRSTAGVPEVAPLGVVEAADYNGQGREGGRADDVASWDWGVSESWDGGRPGRLIAAEAASTSAAAAAGGEAAEAAAAVAAYEPGLRLARSSLAALGAGFGAFLAECQRGGWEVGVVHMKTGRSRLRVGRRGGEGEGEAAG